jgi:hypothetical protein
MVADRCFQWTNKKIKEIIGCDRLYNSYHLYIIFTAGWNEFKKIKNKFLVLTELTGLSGCVLYKAFYWLVANKSYVQLNPSQFSDLLHKSNALCGKRNRFLEHFILLNSSRNEYQGNLLVLKVAGA